MPKAIPYRELVSAIRISRNRPVQLAIGEQDEVEVESEFLGGIMSYFGSGTAQQNLMDYLVYTLKEDYTLTDEELIIVMLSVMSAITDPYDDRLKGIRQRERNE